MSANYAEGLISTYELCARAGVTYRRLDLWERAGLLTPLVRADGSGTARRWGEYQIGEVVEIRELKREQERLSDLVQRKAYS